VPSSPGLLAKTFRAGQLGKDALDWIKTNFYKTELELGYCLCLPQEGPCSARTRGAAPD